MTTTPPPPPQPAYCRSPECCGRGILTRTVELESGICDACDERNRRVEAARGERRTDRLRCTDCSAVLFTEEEEANAMCEACLRRSS
ncbi:MAG: hypothetical protein Q8Q29_08315 [Actinomycetota bacterium]|nr:hypothetical protein [Actinomycetota bacterium]